MSASRCLLALGSLAALVACGTPAPSTADLAVAMVDAMGGREALADIRTLVGEGDGVRTRLGQIPEPGAVDPVATIEGVTETIDLANGRAAIDNDVINGDFTQHRTEVLTVYNGEALGWATTAGRPNMATTPNGLFSWAAVNSPEWLLRRNVVTIALAAVESASDATLAEERTFNGATSLYGSVRFGDEDIDLYFNPSTGLLDGFVTLDTETMLGDVEAEYIFGDYRVAGNVTLPFSVTINKGGRLYSALDYSAIRINDADLSLFEVPGDIIEEAEQAGQASAADGSWSPVTWYPVVPGVFHAAAFSHHSMVVELTDSVVVIEGPYTEAQSLSVARIIEEEIGKPIRYVVPTHPHYDHTGGIRAYAALGADVLVASGHEAELRGIVEAPHMNPPDRLAINAAAGEAVGVIEVFGGMTTIGGEAPRRIDLHEVDVFGHVSPMVIAVVQPEGILFQSDLAPGTPGPDADALYQLAVEHGWNLKTVVGGHGGTTPWAAVVAAASGN